MYFYKIKNRVRGNTGSLTMVSPVWRQSSWPWGMVGRQRDEFLLSSGLQLFGGVEDMSQRNVAGLQWQTGFGQ